MEQQSEKQTQKRPSLGSIDGRSNISSHTTISVTKFLETVEEQYATEGKDVVDPKVAHTLSDLGEQFRAAGDYTQAASYLNEALTMYSRLEGTEIEVVRVRNKLGLVYIAQGSLQFAESSLEQALEDAVEKSPEQADAYYYLGLMHTAQQSYAEAATALNKALTIFQTLNNPGYVARMRYHLGLVYSAQNQHAQAEHCLQEALTVFRSEGEDNEDNDELAEALRHLGLAQQALKHYPEALESFQLALNEYIELDEKQHQTGLTHYHMGTVYLMQNNPSSAIASFTEALTTFGDDNEHVAVTEVRFSLGLAENARQNQTKALEHWNIALAQYRAINEDLKYNSKIEQLLKHIGLAYRAQGHCEYAIASFEQILELYEELYEELGSMANPTVAATHHLMGETYLDDHAMEEARESLTKALKMYQTLNLQSEITTVQILLLSIANQTTTPGGVQEVTQHAAVSAALNTPRGNSSPNIGEKRNPLCCWGFFSSSWSFFSNPQTNSRLPASVKTPLIPTVAAGYGSSNLD
jgi:tetratricopeptide (TPR) repeat protein